jgi:hypothetical protein
VPPPRRPGLADRIAGLLLFLPVPLVLWLLTAQPLGPGASLGTGVAVMLTHRLYARPFALSRSSRRCLWCGGPSGEGPALDVEEPPGRTSWRACGGPHAARLVRTLSWASRHSRFLAAGVLGTLLVFLAGALLAAAGRPAWLVAGDPVAVFRLGIALTVLPLGWLGPRGPLAGDPGPRRPPRVPFAVHAQALVGTLAVVWLFRLVGLWWLAAALLHAARRIGLLPG